MKSAVSRTLSSSTLSRSGLNPTYADVHYNIALLYQASGQSLKAVHHWKSYLKLDPMSPWASIARRELERLYRETIVESKNAETNNQLS